MTRSRSRRWFAVALLGLLPFTLAPRTSWPAGELDGDLVADEYEVDAGQPFVVRAVVEEIDGGIVRDAVAQLALTQGVVGPADITVVAAPRGCGPGAEAAILLACPLDPIPPNQQRTLVFILTSSVSGTAEFTFGVDAEAG